MRPIGQPEAPILTPNAGAGFTLRAGVSVSVTILQKLSDTLYSLRAGGRTLVAESASPLSPGSTYSALVEKAPAGSAGAEKGGFVLRLELGRPVPDSLAELIAGTGLPDDALSRGAALALLGAGDAVERGNLGRVRRAALMGHSGADSMDRAEAAARLESKGLESSPEAVDALLDARDSASGGGRDQSRADLGEHGTSGGAGAQGGPRTAPSGKGAIPASSLRELSLPDPDSDPDGFARGLGSILAELSRRSSMDGASLVAGLANHAHSRSGDSVEFPFHIELDSVAFRGSFRILLPYMPAGPGRLDADFVASRREADGSEKSSAWAFSLRSGGGRNLLLLSSEKSAGRAAPFIEALKRKLAASGCELRLVSGLKNSGDAEKEKGFLDVDA